MAKRRLTRQQTRRVKQKQQERARRVAGDELAASDNETLGPEQEGLLTAHFGSHVEVEGSAGQPRRCHIRANLDDMVVGDRVVWRDGEPTGVVVARLPRDSALSRPDSAGRLKTIAANIDQILVVIAPYPEPHGELIDRYLVAAEAVSVEPVIVLNKTDLLDGDTALAASISALLSPYPPLGYRILHTCASQDRLDELRNTLRDKTSVFVGQSGVGKSSLVNALLPDVDTEVGALSEQRRKGTHTTTTARLYRLDCGGYLIDSPGIREFGLGHLSREEVEYGFRELRPLRGTCRFRDCRHEKEPGCAVLAAEQEGRINPQRLESYRRMLGAAAVS